MSEKTPEESAEKRGGDQGTGDSNGKRENMPVETSAATALNPVTGTATRPESPGGINEDYVCSTRFDAPDNPVFLWVVADGYGDHGSGQWASEQAIVTLRETIGYRIQQAPSGIMDTQGIEEIFLTIHDYIRNESQAQNNEVSVSLTACIRSGNRMLLAHAGANTAYGITAGKITRLTPLPGAETVPVREPGDADQDPSQVSEKDPNPGGVGGRSAPVFDIQHIDPGEADILVLVTSSITDVISNPELRETVVMASSPQQAGNRILDLLEQRGITEDASVVVVNFSPLSKAPAKPTPKSSIWWWKPATAALVLAVIFSIIFWPRGLHKPETERTAVADRDEDAITEPGTQPSPTTEAQSTVKLPPKMLSIQSPWPNAAVFINRVEMGITDANGHAELELDINAPWDVTIKKDGKVLGSELVFTSKEQSEYAALFTDAPAVAVAAMPPQPVPPSASKPQPAREEPKANDGDIRIYTDLPYAGIRINGQFKGLTNDQGTFYAKELSPGNYSIAVGDEPFQQKKVVSLAQGGVVGVRFYFNRPAEGEGTVASVPQPGQETPPIAALPDPILIRFESNQQSVDVKFFSDDRLVMAGNTLKPEEFRTLRPGRYHFVAQKLKYRTVEFFVEIHDGINIIAFDMELERSSP